jgi:RimJ/RimL family protein N-acetyltransferase
MLETERLRLREVTEADAPALLALYRDPTVIQFMGPPPRSLEVEARNIAAHRSNY